MLSSFKIIFFNNWTNVIEYSVGQAIKSDISANCENQTEMLTQSNDREKYSPKQIRYISKNVIACTRLMIKRHQNSHFHSMFNQKNWQFEALTNTYT